MKPFLLLAFLSSTVAAATPQAEAEARARYERGESKYALADFDAAIVEFKAAFELSDAPGLLFNLGQAHRQAKHYEEALHCYRAYLRRSPEASNRADVEQLIAELEEQLPRPRQRRLERASAAVAAPAAQVVEPGPSLGWKQLLAAEQRVVRIELGSGIALLGLGVIGIASGAAVDGKRDAQASGVLYGLGAASVIGGAILTAVGGSRMAAMRRHGYWSLAPLSGGGALAYARRF